MSIAEVKLWGSTIGAVSWNQEKKISYFEYSKEFIKSGIQVAPIHLQLSEQIYSFPALTHETFQGLPGLLADSLPDKFGNALIDAWLAKEGRKPESFNPVERLCYIGTRGMGALEFYPTIGPGNRQSKDINIDALVELASEILTKRKDFKTSVADPVHEEALLDILRVGTSAGGARAKAIIAWNQQTNEIRSGQVDAGEGFTYWLLKFDGVAGNQDKELEDPKGYGLIEYAYHKMAVDAGIIMNECHLLKENQRVHFVTKRFDRTDRGQKIHMLSLGALAHFDFNQAGAHSYEQAFRVMQQLDLPMQSIEQLFLRMTFNIVARNQDDHVKNIAFLMDKTGSWSLAPAFDLTYSYNPSGHWTYAHQMSMNGKRDNFVVDDFIVCEKNIGMKRGRAKEMLRQVQDTVVAWMRYAQRAGVSKEIATKIHAAHRTDILK